MSASQSPDSPLNAARALTPFACVIRTGLRHESGLSFHMGPFPHARPGTAHCLPERGANQLRRARWHLDLHPRLHRRRGDRIDRASRESRMGEGNRIARREGPDRLFPVLRLDLPDHAAGIPEAPRDASYPIRFGLVPYPSPQCAGTDDPGPLLQGGTTRRTPDAALCRTAAISQPQSRAPHRRPARAARPGGRRQARCDA